MIFHPHTARRLYNGVIQQSTVKSILASHTTELKFSQYEEQENRYTLHYTQTLVLRDIKVKKQLTAS